MALTSIWVGVLRRVMLLREVWKEDRSTEVGNSMEIWSLSERSSFIVVCILSIEALM